MLCAYNFFPNNVIPSVENSVDPDPADQDPQFESILIMKLHIQIDWKS